VAAPHIEDADPGYSRVLIVEDDGHIRGALARWLAPTGAELRLVGTVHDALEALDWPPDVIVLDVGLPDGSGLEVAEAAVRMRPIPRMVATSGCATPEQSFQLARLHVEEFIRKPYTFQALEKVLFRASKIASDLTLASALCVGRLGLVEARDLVRRSMTEQALHSADGNRSQAAELLGVTRQAIQAAMKSRHRASR
jgi:DNA-binding NtrC family response regulator